eukprot:XP_028353809.1 putative E3 ubiquitin-protein ligase UNKL [Physeter catodon]
MPSVSKAAAAALSGSPPQTEKPTHYRYLKEFRTEQCSLFVQHKCTQHRPFTCFHWHFLNQRRRRPLRRRDGTFNYSPDVYCSKYDEASGLCPDGDECPYLHRTTGDTERKYHLRYYKTGTCIHETDARGHCVKNGLHCAFAHGPLDLRPPVCDIRELQAQEALQNGQLSAGDGIPDLQPGVLASQALMEKILGEDPRWQDTNFVLGSYKTEQCPKPPRLCRQGYACPHFHNSRDRRRDPRRFQYRSTPCPSVKHGDEWGEPSRCESGDSCQYCHSRTEQQFHPEVREHPRKYVQHISLSPDSIQNEEAMAPLLKYLDEKLALLNASLVKENLSRVLEALWELLLQAILQALGANRDVSADFYGRFHFTLEALVNFFHAEGQGLPLESLRDGSYKVKFGPGSSDRGRGRGGHQRPKFEFIHAPHVKWSREELPASPGASSFLQRLEEELRLHQCSTRECIEQYYLDKLKQRSLEHNRFGRLSVRCHYEAAEQRLAVEVLHAADLLPLDANGLSDPFVIVELGPPHLFPLVRSQRTQIKSRTLHPVYDELFYL